MKKAEIVSVIAKKTDFHKIDVLVILEAFFNETKASLIEGEPVFFRGFGSFIVREKGRRVGRNLTKNTFIEIPEHLAVTFKPANEFRQAIRKNGKSITKYSSKV